MLEARGESLRPGADVIFSLQYARQINYGGENERSLSKSHVE